MGSAIELTFRALVQDKITVDSDELIDAIRKGEVADLVENHTLSVNCSLEDLAGFEVITSNGETVILGGQMVPPIVLV